jgi:uncharacterized protein YceK
MKHTVPTLIVAMAIGLAGCATPGTQTSASASIFNQQRIAALTQAIHKRGGSVSQLLFLEIPSASEAIPDYLSVGLIKAGSPSNAMDALLELLQKAPGAQVAVFGASDAVTIASVQGVLKSFRASPDHSKTTLWVALKNPSGHEEELRVAAQTAGLHLEVLPSL